jgi:hypothetical protein
MTALIEIPNPNPYARAISASKKARWSIDSDVIAGRRLERNHKFLPDSLSLAPRLEFLSESERRFLSQVQGRSYANIFGLVERYIDAKLLELAATYRFGDQTALEALVRFSDEELKHQELFRAIERQAGEAMPAGYRFLLDPNEVARAVLSKSTWAVLGLTLHIELFTLTHYKYSIEPDPSLSPLYKDVFRFHWMEESQHAVLDELEWRRHDREIDATDRERGVDELIELVGAIDGLLQVQSAADAEYFLAALLRKLTPTEGERVRETILDAYRLQYIASGVRETRFVEVLASLIPGALLERVQSALAPLL